MKRLLAIFVVLLLVLGGLFWWRKTEDLSSYSFDGDYHFPLKNNIEICVGETYYKGYDIIDFSRYQSWPSFSDFKNRSLYSVLMEGGLDWHTYSLGNQFEGFNVSSDFFISKTTDTVYLDGRYTLFNLKARELIEFSLERQKDFQDICNEYGVTDLTMKTPEEWLAIWKKEGRLPWFPEHVGR